MKKLLTSSQYLIYTRRSTDDMENQKNTIEYQTGQCLKFALEKRLDVAELTQEGFSENGIIQERHTAYKTSGLKIQKDGRVAYRIERPKFKNLVSLLAKQKYRGVICLCWDRVSRNPHDDAIVKDLLSHGVDIRFVQANYDKTSAGALHMDIDGMFAAHYSRICSEKIRAANVKLRSEGKLTCRSPIGYLDEGPENKPQDPERAPIIKKLFQKYATGEWSMAQLSKWANSQGLTTKPARPRRTKQEIAKGVISNREPRCSPVTIKTIENILHNPFYAGYIAHEKKIMPGIHKALITQKLFFQVQDLFGERNFHSAHRLDKPFFVYRGLVTCGCGRLYSPYIKKGHTYYTAQCKDGCQNTKKTLAEKMLDEVVISILEKVHLTEEEKRQLKNQAPKEFAATSCRQEEKRGEIEKQLARLRKDLSYFEENKITLIREGVYSPQEYSWELQKIRLKLEDINRKKIEFTSSNYPNMLNSLFNFSELVKTAKLSYKATPEEEKHSVLLSFISELKISIENGKEVTEVSPKGGCARLFERHSFPDGTASRILHELPFIYADIKKGFPDWKL